jgi:ADP-heptose:LPS heptosyltransferase
VEVLVLHPGALGDLVLSLPTVALLRARRPGARITIAANLDFLGAVSRRYAERSLSLSTVPLHRLFAGDTPTDDDLRFWRSYDLVLSWLGADDPEFCRALRAANPDSHVGSWRPSHSDTRHVSLLFAGILNPWLGEGLSPGPAEVSVSPDSAAAADRWLREQGCRPGEALVALHPGAGGLAKRWDSRRFARVAAALASCPGCRVVAVEGPADGGLLKGIGSACPPGTFIEARNLPLKTVAGVLQRCDAYLGNDSGVSHLAAALGVPSVVLFGPTLPENWAPSGRSVRVIRRADGCLACTGTAGATHTCLEAIGDGDVLNALRAILP